MRRIRLTSLAQAASTITGLRGRPPGAVDVSEGTWSPARVLHHCAISIECSVHGYPRRKPWPMRVIARAFVLPGFLRQGFMTHDRNTAVPGVEEQGPGPAPGPAVDHLLAAIAAFSAAETLAPHAVFGDQPRDLHDRYHALHLGAFTVDGRPLTA